MLGGLVIYAADKWRLWSLSSLMVQMVVLDNAGGKGYSMLGITAVDRGGLWVVVVLVVVDAGRPGNRHRWWKWGSVS